MWIADWVLAETCTVYMDGRSVYNLRSPGKPGYKGSLALRADEAETLRKYLTRELGLDE